MARIFNTNEIAVPVRVGNRTIRLGPREGWEGAMTGADMAEARKLDGIEVSGEPVATAKPKRKR